MANELKVVMVLIRIPNNSSGIVNQDGKQLTNHIHEQLMGKTTDEVQTNFIISGLPNNSSWL